MAFPLSEGSELVFVFCHLLSPERKCSCRDEGSVLSAEALVEGGEEGERERRKDGGKKRSKGGKEEREKEGGGQREGGTVSWTLHAKSFLKCFTVPIKAQVSSYSLGLCPPS